MRQSLFAALASFVIFALLVYRAAGTGCGEYYEQPGSCTDPQCSRSISNGSLYFCVRGNAEQAPCVNNSDCYINLRCNASICVPDAPQKSLWIGFSSIGVSVVAFGSFLVPARKVEPGNCLFFQFCQASAIVIVGFVVQIWRGAAFFYPYAMIGGMLWCLGNTMAVPAVRMLSLGVAISVWGASNMLLGWASGRFGIWDINKETVHYEWLSYIGVAFAVLGILTFAVVEKSTAAARRAGYTDMALDDSGYDAVANPFRQVDTIPKRDITDYLSVNQMRLLGFFLAVAAGCLFGINFDPPTYEADNFASKTLQENTKYSPDVIDYAFSHFFGILVTATMLLMIFTAADSVLTLPQLFHNDPYPHLILPGFVSGLIWAIGQTGWFLANENLGLVVSFPIIALAPSFVASAYSILLFHEIRGLKNYSALGVSFMFLGIAVACTVLAQQL